MWIPNYPYSHRPMAIYSKAFSVSRHYSLFLLKFVNLVIFYIWKYDLNRTIWLISNYFSVDLSTFVGSRRLVEGSTKNSRHVEMLCWDQNSNIKFYYIYQHIWSFILCDYEFGFLNFLAFLAKIVRWKSNVLDLIIMLTIMYFKIRYSLNSLHFEAGYNKSLCFTIKAVVFLYATGTLESTTPLSYIKTLQFLNCVICKFQVHFYNAAEVHLGGTS